MDDPSAHIRLNIEYEDAEDRALLQDAARAAGVEASELKGIAPIAVIVLVGAGSAVVGAIATWLTGRRRRGKESWGQVIDLRPDAKGDPIYRDKDLEFGQIVVITPTADGKTVEVKVEVYDPDNDFTEIAKLIFGKLADGVVKPLDTVAQGIKDAVGGKAKVEVNEKPDAA